MIEDGMCISEQKPIKKYSMVFIMLCIYVFLCIERPWESVRYLHGIQVERIYAIFLMIIAIVNGHFKIVNNPLNKWVFGLLLIHFLLSGFAYNADYAFDQSLEYAKMVFLFILMLSVVDKEYLLKALIKTYVLSTVLYALHSLWEFHNGRHVWRMGISRMIGVDSQLSDPNAFGASLVLSTPFAFALLRTETNAKMRILYYLYFVLVVLCVVLTGSRSASVALFLLLICWAIMQNGSRKIVILILTSLALSLIWTYMPEEKQERIRTIWDKEAGPANAHSSTDGRRLGFIAGMQMFKEYPFTGVGAGGKNFIEYRKRNLDGFSEQAHNLYAEVLAELGAIGGLLFAGLVFSIVINCLKVKNCYKTFSNNNAFALHVTSAIIICLLLLLLLGLAGHNFYRPLWLWLAAWTGSMTILSNNIRYSKTSISQYDT